MIVEQLVCLCGTHKNMTGDYNWCPNCDMVQASELQGSGRVRSAADKLFDERWLAVMRRDLSKSFRKDGGP